MRAETPGPAARLLALLGEERAALLAGDLTALAALADRKEALTDTLESEGAAPRDAQEITRAAQANQALLQAAMEGLKAASARLDLARSGGPPLSTYGADGRSEIHTADRPRVERRA